MHIDNMVFFAVARSVRTKPVRAIFFCMTLDTALAFEEPVNYVLRNMNRRISYGYSLSKQNLHLA